MAKPNRKILLREEGQGDRISENFVLVFLDEGEFKMSAHARGMDQGQRLQMVLHTLEAFERLLALWIKEATGMTAKRGQSEEQ